MTLLVIVVSIVVIQRLSELLLAGRNYAWAMQNGGREVGADHYWLFVVLHSSWLVVFSLEFIFRQPSVFSWWYLLLGMIAFAQIVRYWAISSLGNRWNTRIIVFKELSTVKSGPYRYVKHPNYIAVAIEIFSIPALLGAWYSAVFFSIANAALLLLIRIPLEEKALQAQFSSADKIADRGESAAELRTDNPTGCKR